MRIAAICAILLSAIAPAQAQESEGIFEIDPLTIDVGELLNCASDVPTYNTFAMSLDDKKYGYRARGWTKVDSKNPFLSEYRLPKPMDVVGGVTETYRTQTIVFSSSAIMAVIDLKDPTELAKSLNIDDYVSFPGKFMGQRVVSETAKDDAELGMRFTSKIAQSVSTVTSHPGKTLYGCSYRIDMEDLPKKK
jgi:hypothetical protein